jgi:hypothetical protein
MVEGSGLAGSGEITRRLPATATNVGNCANANHPTNVIPAKAGIHAEVD